MRRITTFNNVSADGYFVSGEGTLDWTVSDPEIHKSATERMESPGTILFGRKTYDLFESYWPHALESARDPHHPDQQSEAITAMARWINEAEKIVFSQSRQEVTWKGSRLIRELDPRQIVALKEKPGGDMMLFGSGSIASQLSEHGLIDEYQFVINPILLGSGRPLISGVAQRSKLKLVEAKPYASGNVVLRYAYAK